MSSQKESKRKKVLREILFIFIMIIFMLSIIGFHNLDMCHNLITLNYEVAPLNITFAENSLARSNIGGGRCYMEGLGMMVFGCMSLFLISLILLFDREGV